MNCTTEGPQRIAALNLQAERVESLSSPNLLERVRMDIRYGMRKIHGLTPTQQSSTRSKYQPTSSHRFYLEFFDESHIQ